MYRSSSVVLQLQYINFFDAYRTKVAKQVQSKEIQDMFDFNSLTHCPKVIILVPKIHLCESF